MRIIKTLKKKTLRNKASFRRTSYEASSTTDDVVTCPYCGSIAKIYRPCKADDKTKKYCLHNRLLHKELRISKGLGGNRRNSKYVLYRCTECSKIFKVRKRHG